MENKTENNAVINEIENGPGPIDPMTFMTPEQADEENKKADAFIKAFRFGTPEFFAKIKEVFEVEGIKGLKRLEMSLDNYMGIRNMVVAEVMEFQSQHEEEDESDNDQSLPYTEAGEEDCAD